MSLTQIHRYFISVVSKTCIMHNESFSFIHPSLRWPMQPCLARARCGVCGTVVRASPDHRARRESRTTNMNVNLKRELGNVKVKRECET